MSERSHPSYLPSGNPQIMNDSREYVGKRDFISGYLRNNMLPSLQSVFGQLSNGKRKFLGGGEAEIIKGGLIMLAFANENCTLGFKIDTKDRVSIVTNPDFEEDKTMASQAGARNIHGKFRHIVSFSIDSIYDYGAMENFFRYLRVLCKRDDEPILLYGSIDSPNLVLGIEVKKKNNITIASLLRVLEHMSHDVFEAKKNHQ